MTNRREFIQIGITATAWPVMSGTRPGAALGVMPEWAPLSTVVTEQFVQKGVSVMLPFARRKSATPTSPRWRRISPRAQRRGGRKT